VIAMEEDRLFGQSILWRRLDTPGHDACVLWTTRDGGHLAGTAVFLEGGHPCQLRYEVVCDAEWRTRSAVVSGWVGDTPVAVHV